VPRPLALEHRPKRSLACAKGTTIERTETIVSNSINRVVLVGRLTRDPELRALPSGASVCGLRIACNSYRRDAGGEYVDRPNYFDVSVFGPAAENVERYMHKGSRVGVDGRLEWREWETADSQKRQAVSIVADSVQFLDSPATARDGESDGDGGGEESVDADALADAAAPEGDLVF
jgi:single-strand DNA-binding protein